MMAYLRDGVVDAIWVPAEVSCRASVPERDGVVRDGVVDVGTGRGVSLSERSRA